MFPDLPEHLQTLNSISTSPPSGGMNKEYEEAFWNYLNTDEVFNNFGSQPSDYQIKEEISRKSVFQPPVDLKSFVAQFAQESFAPDAALPLPLPYNATASSSTAPTPRAPDINTMDIVPHPPSTPWGDSFSDDGLITGTKKLKQLGVSLNEIEEE